MSLRERAVQLLTEAGEVSPEKAVDIVFTALANDPDEQFHARVYEGLKPNRARRWIQAYRDTRQRWRYAIEDALR